MDLRKFFFGNKDSDAWGIPEEDCTPCGEYDPLNPEPESLIQHVSSELESCTGVSLLQNSHGKKHGLLGLAGYVDPQYRNWEAAYEQWKQGNLTDAELGYANGTWHDAENHKPGWKYLLGL